MTPQQRELLDRMFEGAYELPEAQRHAWLEEHCADPCVLAEVESLLLFSGDHGEFKNALSAAEKIGRSIAPSDVKSIGPYRIVGILGQGGMGTVYEGLREDSDFHQRVAIKILRMSARSQSERRRFLQERQILAKLEHPNIARLFDGGTSVDGSPYIVMERIAGELLIPYVKSRKLPIRQRLQLLREVADAVQYAHRNLIVHRDLKPGNIMVTADGVPKLLDFGIAKLLDTETAGSEAMTATGFHLMTPDYASPEQIRGEPVTAASDIYSLGAILYELLTEVRPHGLKTYDPAEIADRVCVRDVAAPSTCGEPALRGDLDTIVLKAMQKDPARRYNSAEQFSEDMHRYLEGLPVLARPDTATYRMRKFLRRHWVVAGATAAAFAALAAGSAISLYQAHAANAARSVAEGQRKLAQQEQLNAERERSKVQTEAAIANAERDRSQRLLAQMVELANRSLYDVHSAIEKLPGSTEARRQIVGTTLEFLEHLSKDAANDDQLRLVLAEAYTKVGDVQGFPLRPNVGDTQGALRSYQKALDLIVPLEAREPENPQYLRAELAAEGSRASVLSVTSRAHESDQALRRLIPKAQKAARLCPADADCLLAEARIFGALALTLQSSSDSEGLQYARRERELLADLVQRFPEREEIRSELATAYSQEAAALNRTQQTQAAAQRYQRAIELREKLIQKHPSDVLMLRLLMISYGNLGGNLGSPFYSNLGDTGGARASYGKALEIARRLAAADPADQLAKSDLAHALLFYSSLDLPRSEWESSLALLRQADGIMQALISADPESPPKQVTLSMIQQYEGRRLHQLGRPEEAELLLRQSLEAAANVIARSRTHFGAFSQVLEVSDFLGELLLDRGKISEALQLAQDSVARTQREGSLPNANPDRVSTHIAIAYRTLAAALARQGNCTESHAAAEKSAAGWRHLREQAPGYWNRVQAERAEALLELCPATVQ